MSSTTISQERWHAAQALERSHWEGGRVGMLLEAAGTFANIIDMLGQARCQALFDARNVLDVGSGPWALNLAGFYPHLERVKRWTAAEPLPRLDARSLDAGGNSWASGFLAWLAQRLERLEYVQVSGEALPFDAAFDTVTCINVLDHVRAPAEILANIRRALTDGGRLLLAVDCLSLAGRLKFEWFTRRRHPNSFIVKAHPFSFRVGHVRRLLAAAGFHVDEVVGAPSGSAALFGRAHRPIFICSVR